MLESLRQVSLAAAEGTSTCFPQQRQGAEREGSPNVPGTPGAGGGTSHSHGPEGKRRRGPRMAWRAHRPQSGSAPSWALTLLPTALLAMPCRLADSPPLPGPSTSFFPSPLGSAGRGEEGLNSQAHSTGLQARPVASCRVSQSDQESVRWPKYSRLLGPERRILNPSNSPASKLEGPVHVARLLPSLCFLIYPLGCCKNQMRRFLEKSLLGAR